MNNYTRNPTRARLAKQKSPTLVQMPEPEISPEDGLLFSVGDDTFRVTAEVERVPPVKRRAVSVLPARSLD